MATYQIELSDPKQAVPILSGFLSDILVEEKVPFEIENAMQLCAEEAVVNIFKHGYNGAEGPVRVSFTLDDNRAILEIEDEAPFFNPLTLPSPDVDAGLDERKIGGLGVYLIRSLMDDVRYRETPKGNSMVMEKSFSR